MLPRFSNMATPTPRKLTDDQVKLTRTVACHSLLELAHSRVLDLFLTVVDDLKKFKAPKLGTPKGPGELVRQLQSAIDPAKIIIRAEEDLSPFFPQPTEGETKLLNKLFEIIEEIEGQIISPLRKLEKQGLSPKSYEPRYRQIAKRGVTLARKLLKEMTIVEERLWNSAAKLGTAAENTPVKVRKESKRVACVSIDMAKYSELARQIQGRQDPEALFSFNQRLQTQLRAALKDAGADPAQVPIDDAGDGALIYLPTADLAVKFAIQVQRDTFAKNLEIPKDEWWQHLRIGIDVGIVVLETFSLDGRILSFNSAGVPIINAVRIQSNCRKGRIAVSRATWGNLSEKLKLLFGPMKTTGKKKPHEPALEMCVTKAGAGL